MLSSWNWLVSTQIDSQAKWDIEGVVLPALHTHPWTYMAELGFKSSWALMCHSVHYTTLSNFFSHCYTGKLGFHLKWRTVTDSGDSLVRNHYSCIFWVMEMIMDQSGARAFISIGQRNFQVFPSKCKAVLFCFALLFDKHCVLSLTKNPKCIILEKKHWSYIFPLVKTLLESLPASND